MRQITAFIMALALCITMMPSIGGAAELVKGDNIWIAISPTESHPALVDRPAAVLPSIDSYRIRVSVYSNPYAEIEYAGIKPFYVTSLVDNSVKLKLKTQDGKTIFARPYTVHKESDDKYTYIFMVSDFNGAFNSDVTQLIFTATDGVTSYRGSGVVKIIGGGSGESGSGAGSGSGSGSGGGAGSGSGGGSGSGAGSGSGGSGRGR